MKPCIIFDLDGTLLDSLQDLCNAVNHTLSQFGYPQRTLDEVRSFVGTGARNLIRFSLPEESSEETVDEVLAAYQEYYAAHSTDLTCPYAGILDALAQLEKEFSVGVVSNKPDRAVKPLCKQFFGDIYALGETAAIPRKPAPDMIHYAMAQLGADRCVYVGDSEVDVLTAKNTGVPCLSVLWGFRDKACLERAGAQHFCSTPSQLPQMIKEILYGK